MHINVTYKFIEVFVFHYLWSWFTHKSSYTFVIFCFDLWILKYTFVTNIETNLCWSYKKSWLKVISGSLFNAIEYELNSEQIRKCKTFRLKSCTERRILRVCHRSSVSECIEAAFSFLKSDGEPQSLLTSSAGREEGHRDLLNIHSTLHPAGE